MNICVIINEFPQVTCCAYHVQAALMWLGECAEGEHVQKPNRKDNFCFIDLYVDLGLCFAKGRFSFSRSIDTSLI